MKHSVAIITCKSLFTVAIFFRASKGKILAKNDINHIPVTPCQIYTTMNNLSASDIFAVTRLRPLSNKVMMCSKSWPITHILQPISYTALCTAFLGAVQDIHTEMYGIIITYSLNGNVDDIGRVLPTRSLVVTRKNVKCELGLNMYTRAWIVTTAYVYSLRHGNNKIYSITYPLYAAFIYYIGCGGYALWHTMLYPYPFTY